MSKKNAIPKDIFKNVVVCIKLENGELIPMRVQIGRKDASIQVEADHGENGEKEGLEIIEILEEIFRDKLSKDHSRGAFTRKVNGVERVDAIRINL